MSDNQNKSYAEIQQANIKAERAANRVAAVAPVTYVCNVQSAGYAFKTGKRAQFIPNVDGINCYTTNIPSEIAELDEEVANGHTNITHYTGEVAPLIEPLEVLRSRFFAEFEAKQAEALKVTNDAGNSPQIKLNVAGSDKFAKLGAASNSVEAVAV